MAGHVVGRGGVTRRSKENPTNAENRRAMFSHDGRCSIRRRSETQPLRSPSAARFHWVTFSAMARVDFIAAWLS